MTKSKSKHLRLELSSIFSLTTTARQGLFSDVTELDWEEKDGGTGKLHRLLLTLTRLTEIETLLHDLMQEMASD